MVTPKPVFPAAAGEEDLDDEEEEADEQEEPEEPEQTEFTLVVTGAGTHKANGKYLSNAEFFEERRLYKHTVEAGVSLYFKNMRWVICQEGAGYNMYCNSTRSELPPRDAWKCEGAVPPAPQIERDEEDDAIYANSARRGTAHFHEKKMEHQDLGILAHQLAKIAKLQVSVTQLGDDTWRVYGLHTDTIMSNGLQRLDAIMDRDKDIQFPCNDKGRCLVFCSSLFKALLSGDRLIKEVPPTEAASAQRDLRLLSLRQMLQLKTINLDFQPGGNSIHKTFLGMLDDLLFKSLGKQAVGSEDAEESSYIRLGRDLVMLTAIAKSVSASMCWVLWFEKKPLYINMGSMSCTDAASLAFDGKDGVLEYTDKSEPDRIKGGMQFDYTVRRVTDVSNLTIPVKAKAGGSAQAAKAAPGGSKAVGFVPVSNDELKNAMGALKSVNRNTKE